MKKHLTTLMALTVALAMPLSAIAQDAAPLINPADIFGSSAEAEPAPAVAETTSESAPADEENTTSSAESATTTQASDSVQAETTPTDNNNSSVIANINESPKASQKSADSDDDEGDEEDEKSWYVSADVGFDLGLGAFTKHEYARKIRSRFAMELSGSYTIPVIDVDVYAITGFSVWMSKAGGTNGQHEFRWADSAIGFSRNIWEYKNGGFEVSFDADLGFVLPTSTASINTNLYTSIVPDLSVSIKFHKLRFSYEITYSHSFHKYTSTTLDPSEVDILSRSAGLERINQNNIAVGGVLNEIDLTNLFVVGYQFIKPFGMRIGFGFADSWTYDNGTISADDEFVNPNAKVGRGHSQLSVGTISLLYSPIKYLTLSLAMVSQQPWKTADNKTLRFPWFDTVSPSKNYTKFVFGAKFVY